MSCICCLCKGLTAREHATLLVCSEKAEQHTLVERYACADCAAEPYIAGEWVCQRCFMLKFDMIQLLFGHREPFAALDGSTRPQSFWERMMTAQRSIDSAQKELNAAKASLAEWSASITTTTTANTK